MCTNSADNRRTLIFPTKKKKGMEKSCSLPHVSCVPYWLLQSPGCFSIFPCPAIFSQVLIFSFRQAHSLQPPHHFQRSGLHANCLSMARLPPTYIMHLVSSTQSRPSHFSSFKFCGEIASG